jgi:uncharacterized Zn-binding protein involved in type VI secretion
MHTCPMVTGIVPHVGGPILPPGCPTVLIGFLPAARATDLATCVGPPDSIAMGSPTVLIGNLMAARIGDPTVHGGVIVLGCMTVMIGIPGMGSPGAPGGGAGAPGSGSSSGAAGAAAAVAVAEAVTNAVNTLICAAEEATALIGIGPACTSLSSAAAPAPPASKPPTPAPAPTPGPKPAPKTPPPSTHVDKTVTETISNAPAGSEAWNGTYSWKSKFTAAVDKDNCTVTTTVKIKVSGTISDAQKSGWKTAVESKWNGKAKLCCPGGGCADGYKVVIVLEFVSSGEDYTVTANTPAAQEGGRAGLGGTTSMTGWGVNDTTDITHEFGHMLGNPEEYFTTDGTDYSEGGTKNGFRDADGGIMNNPANDPLPRNYQPIADAAKATLGASTPKGASDAC